MEFDAERLRDALSSKHWLWILRQECPPTLIDAYKKLLPHIAQQSWQERLHFGGAFVNGKAVYCDLPLKPPCKIEYFETKYGLHQAYSFFPQFDERCIVYSDSDLAIAAKPAGLPCFEAREQRLHNFRAQVCRHFGRAVHMPSRLDTSVAGLVVFSLSEQAHHKLQRIFEQRKIEKSYLLQVESAVSWESKCVEASIGKDGRHPILRTVVNSGGKSARTEFRRMCGSLLRARPVTGRTHQIRVHAAHIGLPIVGDNFYGGAPNRELNLASAAVRLPHPMTEQEIHVRLPPQLFPQWLRAFNFSWQEMCDEP